MIEKAIQRIFDNRSAAHVAHWRTKSFAQHATLGEFYEAVTDKLDDFVETYQGGYGPIGEVKGVDDKDIVQTLHKEFVWLTANREALCKGAKPLENIFDDLTALYLRTIYKLENLE